MVRKTSFHALKVRTIHQKRSFVHFPHIKMRHGSHFDHKMKYLVTLFDSSLGCGCLMMRMIIYQRKRRHFSSRKEVVRATNFVSQTFFQLLLFPFWIKVSMYVAYFYDVDLYCILTIVFLTRSRVFRKDFKHNSQC